MKRRHVKNIIFGIFLILSFGLGFLISSIYHLHSQNRKIEKLKPIKNLSEIKIRKEEYLNFTLATYFPEKGKLLVNRGNLLSELEFDNTSFKKIEKDDYVFIVNKSITIITLHLKPKNKESVLQIRKG